MMHGRIAKAAAAGGLALALCGGVAACGSGSNGTSTTSGGTSTTVPTDNGGSGYSDGSGYAAPQQAADSAAPQPSGMPVCDDLTEIGGDLATLQNGPSGNYPQALQALGVQLSKVVAETSQQSSDLGTLIQDFNTDVTETSDGTDLGTNQDPDAAVNGDSRMDDDLNAVMSDCGGS